MRMLTTTDCLRAIRKSTSRVLELKTPMRSPTIYGGDPMAGCMERKEARARQMSVRLFQKILASMDKQFGGTIRNHMFLKYLQKAEETRSTWRSMTKAGFIREITA